jgi:hypothetical protein
MFPILEQKVCLACHRLPRLPSNLAELRQPISVSIVRQSAKSASMNFQSPKGKKSG